MLTKPASTLFGDSFNKTDSVNKTSWVETSRLFGCVYTDISGQLFRDCSTKEKVGMRTSSVSFLLRERHRNAVGAPNIPFALTSQVRSTGWVEFPD